MTKPKHTLQDHLYGAEHDHAHEDDADHDHDHDHDLDPAGPLEENPLWVHDNIALTSVGIDIGSAGTQVIFSRLHMRRMGEDLSSRYFVVNRETLYQSPVARSRPMSTRCASTSRRSARSSTKPMPVRGCTRTTSTPAR